MKDLQLDDGGVPAEDRINRTVSWRGFLRLAAVAAGGSVAALACGVEATLVAPTAIPAMATPPPTEPQAGVRVAENDPRIRAGPVEFQGNGDSLKGYFSRPTGPGPHPAVLVIHENRGLLPHFSDVTRRLAVEGYAALAIDMLSREGGTGTFASTDAARDALRKIARDQIVGDADAGVAYLQAQDFVRRERVGVMGFCFGGSITWLLAVRNPEIRAAVPFYGSDPPLEEVPNMNVPVLGIFGSEDNRINAGVPDLEAALKGLGKTYKFRTFEGANHAFFNDTGRRYHPEAAGGAWRETLAWFETHLMS